MSKPRKRLLVPALLATPFLSLPFVLAGGPATAASTAGSHAAARPTWFQLKSADLANTCISEKGTTSAIAGVPCSSNHSDFWKWTSTSELLNEHSGKCLSVTGSDPGVYVNTCVNNHAQLWLNQLLPVIAGGKLYSYVEYVNVHTRDSLGLNATGTTVVQESSGDTLWVIPG